MADQVSIFISHKHEDGHAAMNIKEILTKFDHTPDPKLKFYLSEEISGGADWYNWIKTKLEESNLLLLLFTDVTKSWDWCLYEAGLFDRLDDNHHKRIICLHSSTTTPPDPLRNLQAFPARSERLQAFLTQLFVQTDLTGLDQPIAPWLVNHPNNLIVAANEIAALIDRKPVETRYLSKFLFIRVRDPALLTKERIPPDAAISSNGKTLEIFDKTQGDWEWGAIESNARLNSDNRWLDELAERMFVASKGDIPRTIRAVFQSRQGKAMYSPVLYRVDTLADGAMIFKILFNEDTSWKLDDVPHDHAIMLTSVVMATRFKYELITKYCGNVRGASSEKLLAKCDDIRRAILNIENESASRGLLEPQTLIKLFKDVDQDTIRDMYENWGDIRQNLLDSLETGDAEKIESYLSELRKMNKEYLALAIDQYKHIALSA